MYVSNIKTYTEKRKMGKDDDVIGAVAAILLGLVGLAILASVFGPRCPKCNKPIDRGIKRCPHCGAMLEW
jgi:hypothetical protein